MKIVLLENSNSFVDDTLIKSHKLYELIVVHDHQTSAKAGLEADNPVMKYGNRYSRYFL